MRFLNCNYPDACKIPKGKPKEIEPQNTIIELKMKRTKLIVLNNGHVYFAEGGYYWGLSLEKFIAKRLGGMISVVDTVANINTELMEWGSATRPDVPIHQHLLSDAQATILRFYLFSLR